MSKKTRSMAIVFLTLGIIFISLNFFSIRGYAWEIDRTDTVERIIDGDTLETSEETIRLADINTPEVGESGADKATAYLSTLVNNKEIYIDVDDIYGVGPYGRTIAVIYVYYNETHLINVNKALLVGSYAVISNYNNEFNPYEWTLYVVYQSNPPPTPPPSPTPPPPPNSPPEDDNTNNQLNNIIYIWIGIGISLIIFSTILVIFAFNNSIFIKLKENIKKILFTDKGKKERMVENDIVYEKNSLVFSIVSDLLNRFPGIIISVYGIGSYFEASLPPNWVKNDLDIIVFVKSLEEIPKQDWTEIRYEKKEVNGTQLWLGFNTLEAYRDKNKFSKESFSNYEWNLIDMKHPENSKLLYGENIQAQLPETDNLIFDYNDVLARGLYHLEKSLKEKNTSTAMKECSKGIFKLGFYFCIYFDPTFRSTTIMEIGRKLQQLSANRKVIKKVVDFYENAIIFRITDQYKTEFKELRSDLITYIFSLLYQGVLHKKMDYKELINYLTDSFSGFPYLIQAIKKLYLHKH